MCSKLIILLGAACLAAALVFYWLPDSQRPTPGVSEGLSVPAPDAPTETSVETEKPGSDSGPLGKRVNAPDVDSPAATLSQNVHERKGTDSMPPPSLSPSPSSSSPSLSPAPSPSESAFDRQRIEREFHRAEILSEYGEPGEESLSEVAFRRYAEDRFVKNYDLNGDGIVDGFELRAMAGEEDPAPRNTPLSSRP